MKNTLFIIFILAMCSPALAGTQDAPGEKARQEETFWEYEKPGIALDPVQENEFAVPRAAEEAAGLEEASGKEPVSRDAGKSSVPSPKKK